MRITPSQSDDNVMTEEFGIERASMEYNDAQTGFEEDSDLGVSELVCSDIATDQYDQYSGQESDNQTETGNTVQERHYPSRVRRPNQRYQDFIPWYRAGAFNLFLLRAKY